MREQSWLSKSCAMLTHFQIRKRDAQFPIATGLDYTYQQPTSIVHTGKHGRQTQTKAMAKSSADYTRQSAVEAVQQQLGLNPDDYSRIIAVKYGTHCEHETAH